MDTEGMLLAGSVSAVVKLLAGSVVCVVEVFGWKCVGGDVFGWRGVCC